MKFARLIGGSAALCACAAAALLFGRIPARSFDLQGSPTTVKRPAADITDTYFFPSPTNPNNVVAVMDVYPLIAPGAGLSTYFDHSVLYTMKFDNKYASEAANGGRPIEDLVIQFSFGAPSGGTQQVFVYGPAAPNQVGARTTLVDGGLANGSGFINRPFTATSSVFGTVPFTVFAGARRDPSFFNTSQFWSIFPDRNQGSTATSCLSGGASPCPNGFTAGPSNDGLANSNVLSIVVELPKSAIVNGQGGVVAYWATTSTTSGQ
jgi:hypothetical protein